MTLAEHHLIPPSPHQRAPLERAIEEIRQAEAISAATRRREMRSKSMVAQLDRLIEELEKMHLRGGQRVPNSMAARLQQFLEALPPQCQRVFPLRTRIAYVLDDLFEVQDLLLNLMVTGRSALAADDLDLEADDEAELTAPATSEPIASSPGRGPLAAVDLSV